jgi:hypothetical protein
MKIAYRLVPSNLAAGLIWQWRMSVCLGVVDPIMKTETPSTPPLQKLMLPNLDAFSW